MTEYDLYIWGTILALVLFALAASIVKKYR